MCRGRYRRHRSSLLLLDLHNACLGLDASNPDFKAVAPVGDAFLGAVQRGMATRNMYASDAQTDGLIDLWWDEPARAPGGRHGRIPSRNRVSRTVPANR